jgi:flagellar motility protein MotE (MotC chaperone)
MAIVQEQYRPMRIPRHVAHLGIAALVLVQAFPALAEGGATGDAGQGFELAADPTMPDADPTMIDTSLTLGAEISQTNAGGSHTPAGAEAEVAADVQPSAHVTSSAPGCVIDISSSLVVDDAGGAEPTGASAAQATADHTPSGNGGEAEPECVSMVDALVTRADGSQVAAPAAGISATEALLLTRLEERRTELDTQDATLELQEDLLRAAELRLEERAALLEASANELGAAVDAEAAKKAEEIAGLAKLFETMKPKDAAAVMAGLPDETLVPLAKLVSTRKLAPIMAEFPPEQASALTVLLTQAD